MLTVSGKTYELDATGFLMRSGDWDQGFAEAIAPELGIAGGLTQAHWKVLRFIRDSHRVSGRCPMVYQTCRANGLRLGDLKALFPTGYLRGACKAAGLTYREADLSTSLLPAEAQGQSAVSEAKTYRVDPRGFLVDPAEWDEAFSVRLAGDLKMKDGLQEGHWRVIRFLRDAHAKTGAVPTVYETCERLGLELEDLERLFPDGYHRGAVRIAGLCAR